MQAIVAFIRFDASEELARDEENLMMHYSISEQTVMLN
jgi:hypothetical protein